MLIHRVLSVLSAAACTSTASAFYGPVVVLDLAGYGEQVRVKALAAGGTEYVCGVIDTPYSEGGRKSTLWYSPDRGQASSLVDLSTAARTPSYVPARIESFLGISAAGNLSLSVELSPTPMGQFNAFRRFFDSHWEGKIELLEPSKFEGGPLPAALSPVNRWRFTSRPGITSDSQPYWLGGEAALERSAAINRSIFIGSGTSTRRLLSGGDTIDPDGAAVGTSTSIEAFSVSPFGDQLIAVVAVDRGYADSGEWRVIRRIGTQPPSTLISQSSTWEGHPVRRFYLPLAGGISNCGQPARWAVAADLLGSADTDSVLIVDNQLAFREGSGVGELALSGPPLMAQFNATNDLLFLWGAKTGSAAANTAAFVNNGCVLKVGDGVDSDADGELNATSFVTFIGPVGAISNVAQDGLVSVYLSVHINGTPAIVRLRVPGTPGIATADFNGDGASGLDDDIEAFFLCLGGNCCHTCYAGGSDINGDGASGTDDDIEAFFRILGGSNC